MIIKPFDGLPGRDLMKILYEETMRDYSDTNVFFGEYPKGPRRAGHGRKPTKELSLNYRELVKRLIAPWRGIDSPFRQTPGNALRKRAHINTQPLGRDRTKSRVEIRTNAVKIDTEDEPSTHRLTSKIAP